MSEFTLVQHNIGTMNYQFQQLLYDTSGYRQASNIVKTKLPDTDHPYRTVHNYLNTRDYLSDIYTLQEVQQEIDSDQAVQLLTLVNPDNEYPYSGVYTRTGNLHFSDASETGVQRIHHGCVVLFNTNRFEWIGEIPHSHETLARRSTSWVLLRDKITREEYAVISLHGTISSNLTNASKTIDIYENLMLEIHQITTTPSASGMNWQVIIGTDLNINLFNPNLNPFGVLSDHQTHELHGALITRLHQFVEFLQHHNIISVTDGTIPTNYSYHEQTPYRESLDFILVSNNLIPRSVTIYDIYEGDLLDVSDTQHMVDDYDHRSLDITFQNGTT
jgi:hypothetical protein